MSAIHIFIICKVQGFLLILANNFALKKNILLACSTSSTSLASARSITIQLRFAALYMMHYRLFQQTLNRVFISE